MSNFCTKCGAAISPTDVFCPTCGNPIPAGPGTQPTSPTPAQTTPPPPAAYYAPPPSGVTSVQGGSAVKLILIIVGVVVLLGILAVGIVGLGVYRVAHSVHVDKNGSVAIDTPNGRVTSGANASITPADLGVDIYPGATRGQGGVNISSPKGSMASAVYLTNDPVDQVVDFYKSQLGGKASVVQTATSTMLTRKEEDSRDQRDNVFITISKDDANTKITILHSKKKS